MPYPVVQALGAVAHSNSAAVSPAWPAHQAGDIGILVVGSAGYGTRLTVPAGFEQIHSSPQRDPGPQDFHAAQLNVYWKRATGAAEPAPTVEFIQDYVHGFIFTIRGAGASGRPFTDQGGDASTSSTSVSFPDVTTEGPEELIMHILAHSTDSSAAQVSGYANPNLTDITEHLDYSTNVANGEGLALVSGKKATAGNTGRTTATLATTSRHARITLSFSSSVQPEAKEPFLKGVGDPAERNTAGTISPAWPAHEAGDVALLMIESGAWPITFTNQQGFTEVAGSPQNAGANGGNGSSQLAVFWKRAASGAEPAPVIDRPASQHVRAIIVTFKNCVGSGDPVDVSAGSNVAATTSAFSAPGGTTTGPNRLVAIMGSHSFDNVAPDQWSGWNNPDLRYLTERYESGSVVGNGSGFALATGVIFAPTTFSTTTAALRGSTYQGRIMVALKGQGGLLLQLSPGTFTLTGQPISIKHNRKMLLGQGVFTLAGQVLTLRRMKSFIMLLSPGIFSLVGSSLNIRKTSRGWSFGGKRTSTWTKKPPLEI